MRKILIIVMILLIAFSLSAKRIKTDNIKATSGQIDDLEVSHVEVILPTETLTYSGTTVEMVNGNTTAVEFGDICYFAADGDLEFADADTLSTMPGLFIAIESISAGASGLWLSAGSIRNNLWTLTQGGYVYVTITGTTGNTWSQTAPSGSGNNIQIIGIAKSSNTIYFNPDFLVIKLK